MTAPTSTSSCRQRDGRSDEGFGNADATPWGSIFPMTDLVPAADARPLPAAISAALGTDVPDIEALFLFAREAELRVRTLRMTIEEHDWNAKGDSIAYHDLLLRHPRLARITTRRDLDPLSSDYDIWIGDGERIRTFRASDNRASDRAVRPPVVPPAASDLPRFARTYAPLTQLPAGSAADAFIHPHGLFRNVLLTGPLTMLGTRDVHGREAIVVRSDHPRATKVLTDRPDRRVEVGIDRATGFVIHLSETVGGTPTHLAEATLLDVDADIPDNAFEVHLSSDVRMLY